MKDKVTVPLLAQMKERHERLVMVTCYDYPSALLLDGSGIDLLLVGDSVGDNVLGYPNTLPVTMDEMVHHCRAVTRGVRRALVIGDMPFMSYQASVEDAVRNAGRLLQEAGAHAVKLEGGAAVVPTVRRLVDMGIPVMGHLGLTPQSVHQFGGYRIQGREQDSAQRIANDAESLAEAGAFAIVLELLAPSLAESITASVPVPTIGIGSGPNCDGQVQVFHDLFGLYPERSFRHVRRYAEAGRAIREAAAAYASDVRTGRFPAE